MQKYSLPPPVVLPPFHEMSNVEFEIARQKLEQWEVLNPISVVSSATIPEQKKATSPGKILSKNDVDNCLKIMTNRGNLVKEVSPFIAYIEEKLIQYPDFMSWKTDPNRDREPMSITEVLDYGFRVKRYNS